LDLPVFLSELRRRRVVRVVLAYGVVAFAALQVAEPILAALGLGERALRAVVTGLAAGFPLAAVLAWIYDLTPKGLERTAPRAEVPAAAPGAPSVAVLPFADLSPDRDQAWFCDGVAEELLTALCCVPGLRVVSRSSSFQFRGRDVGAHALGQALGATTLLEGSVRRAGGRVRVSARIVDASRGLDLWSESFDRALEDIFAVQEEIALAVVRALRLRLGGEDESRLRKVGASRGTRDLRAYDLYLRGRHALRQLSLGGMQEARDAFRRALAIDQDFAQAHAGLADADVLVLTWNLDGGNGPELEAEALAASEAALRLEPDLAEARLARANVLVLLGRIDEAERDFRFATDLNPGWADGPYFHARALMTARRYEEAAIAFEEAVRRDPDDYASLALLENAQRKLGRPEAVQAAGARALAAVERRLAIAPDDVRALYLGAALDHGYGDRARGDLRMERALELDGDDFTVIYNAACFYARAGNVDRALGYLDRAVQHGRGSRAWISQDPDFEALHGDPRFEALLARMKR